MTADRDDALPAPAPAAAWAKTQAEARRAARVASQNDAFRRALVPGGAPCPLAGRVVLTQRVAARGPAFAGAALLAVAADEAFAETNDPEGDHAFGTVDVEGVTVWWRITSTMRIAASGASGPTTPRPPPASSRSCCRRSGDGERRRDGGRLRASRLGWRCRLRATPRVALGPGAAVCL